MTEAKIRSTFPELYVEKADILGLDCIPKETYTVADVFWRSDSHNKNKHEAFEAGANNVFVSDGEIIYVTNDGKTIKTEAIVTLIARVEFDNDEQNLLWRWGYSLADDLNGFKGKKIPKLSWNIPSVFPFLKEDEVAMTTKLAMVVLAHCAIIHDFDIIEEVRLGPHSKRKHFFGLTDIKKVNRPLAEVIQSEAWPPNVVLFYTEWTYMFKNIYVVVHFGCGAPLDSLHTMQLSSFRFSSLDRSFSRFTLRFSRDAFLLVACWLFQLGLLGFFPSLIDAANWRDNHSSERLDESTNAWWRSRLTIWGLLM